MATQNPYSDSLLMDAFRGSLSNAESLGRGFAVAPVGLLGDVNALARQYITPRLPSRVQGLLQAAPAAPTTEQILSNIPRASAPRMETSGMEQLGAAMNFKGPVDVARGAERAAMAAGRAGERYAERVVPQIMERGGMPAQLLGDLSQGSIRQVIEKNPAPFIVKHGTNQPFDEFKSGMGVTAKHIYTTPEEYAQDAAKYGDTLITAKASPKSLIDFSSEGKLDKQTISALKKAAKDAGITDKYYPFESFIDDVMSGQLYQKGGGSRDQDALLSELLSKYQAVKMPDATSGGGISKSVVFEDPSVLKVLKDEGLLGQQAKSASAFDVSKRDASEIFGAGAERVMYKDPTSGGAMEVLAKPDGTASVLSLEVPEKFRGKGIGESLQAKVMQDFPSMMGQVSSKAAAKTAYRLGRRPPSMPDATLDDVYKLMDENSSVNLVSPEMQKRFVTEGGLLGQQAKSAFTYPQEEAMRLAQQRAALPVEQGGLGLLPNNTAQQRADAMFPFDVYHGTKTEIKSIDPDKSLINKAFFTSEDPNFASSPAYTGYINPPSKGGGNVMPLRINKSNANVVDELSYNPMVEAGYIENIRNLGNDLIDVQKDKRNIILNPDVVRSRFAAFDPWRKTAATAAAMGVAAPDLLAQEQPVITQQQIDDELAMYGLLGR